jgi:hypothetical protein
MQTAIRPRVQRQTILAGVDLRRFDLRIEQVRSLDEHGHACDRASHEHDEQGRFPLVEAQAYFTGHDGTPRYVTGCLACVAAAVADLADGDRLTVIELEHLP